MSYKHLTIEERACIAQYLKQGIKISRIAELLGRNKSTISRELKRNPSRDQGYNAIGAQRKYNKRRKKCIRHSWFENEELFNIVKQGLQQYWSPEQIVNTLPQGYTLSVSTVYRGVDKKIFPEQIRKKLRRYGKHLKRNQKKTQKICYDFSQVRTINQRPAIVETREEFGHWELDTIVLRQECGCHIATFIERKTRFLLCRKIQNKTAKCMGDAIIEAFRELPSYAVKTLTVDRGLEFTDWQRIEKELDAEVYFCDPYSPHQRGSNENTNGLIRQFFPRRKLLPKITANMVLHVQDLINSRPRKVLHFSSPYQSFLLHLA